MHQWDFRDFFFFGLNEKITTLIYVLLHGIFLFFNMAMLELHMTCWKLEHCWGQCLKLIQRFGLKERPIQVSTWIFKDENSLAYKGLQDIDVLGELDEWLLPCTMFVREVPSSIKWELRGWQSSWGRVCQSKGMGGKSRKETWKHTHELML